MDDSMLEGQHSFIALALMRLLYQSADTSMEKVALALWELPTQQGKQLSDPVKYSTKS